MRKSFQVSLSAEPICISRGQSQAIPSGNYHNNDPMNHRPAPFCYYNRVLGSDAATQHAAYCVNACLTVALSSFVCAVNLGISVTFIVSLN